ncbi:PRC-barrel domain-containing protein [Phycisphaerales bacterium AB-hyl4]|uniref:PRC-barrel domain-containing protein n=1 Tax=Natronomicrosphaera hydrolytica TaxID=3242702 RepID=A0ABV4U4I3_9BACT
MTEAGVDQQQAQQESQRLAQQLSQQPGEREQIQQQIEQALTQAGVEQEQAQQESQRLAQRVHQQFQQAGLVEREPRVYRYNELLDFEVRGRDDQEIGQLQDLVIDTREGRVIYGILSYGGILGIGEELAPVPFQALQFDEQEERFTLDATEEQLDQVAYQEGEEPDWQDQQWAMQTHQAFDEEPYWQVFGYAPPGEEGMQQQQQQQREHQQREQRERQEREEAEQY